MKDTTIIIIILIGLSISMFTSSMASRERDHKIIQLLTKGKS